MSWIEVQFLKKAVDVLCLCRQTLMFTYVFAFYLKKNNQSIIFEVNHVHWVYQCLVSHGNRFNLSLPFYVVVVTGMLVMPCLLCAFFYAQRCFYKEVQTYNDKFHYDLKTYLEAKTCWALNPPPPIPNPQKKWKPGIDLSYKA